MHPDSLGMISGDFGEKYLRRFSSIFVEKSSEKHDDSRKFMIFLENS